jgi:hypothetical protein
VIKLNAALIIEMTATGPIKKPRKNAAMISTENSKITITTNGIFNFDKKVMTLVWFDDNNSFLGISIN